MSETEIREPVQKRSIKTKDKIPTKKKNWNLFWPIFLKSFFISSPHSYYGSIIIFYTKKV